MMDFGLGSGYACGFYGGGGFTMMFIGLLLIGLLIYIIVKPAKKIEAKSFNNTNESLDILNIRFAKGEIDENEYLTRKAALLK